MERDIKLVKSDDISDIVSLYVSTDPRHLRSSVYYNYSNNTTFGNGICVLAKNKNKEVIGHYSIIPLEFSFNNKKISVGYAQQAIIHPEYRDLKLICSLHNKAIELVKDRFDFVFAFSNDNFVQVKEKLLSWKNLGTFDSDLINLNEIKDDINHDVVSVNSFKTDFENDKELFSICRTKEYLNYKFFKHPLNHYKVFGIYNKNKLEAYIVLKFYKNENENELIGHFIDFVASSEEMLSSLMAKAKSYFRFYGVNKVIFWNKSKYRKYLKNYIKEKSFKTNFLLYDFNKSNEFIKQDKWDLSMMLSDAF